MEREYPFPISLQFKPSPDAGPMDWKNLFFIEDFSVTDFSDLKIGMLVLQHPSAKLGEEACARSGVIWSPYAMSGIGEPCKITNLHRHDESVQLQAITSDRATNSYFVYYTLVRPLTDDEFSLLINVKLKSDHDANLWVTVNEEFETKWQDGTTQKETRAVRRQLKRPPGEFLYPETVYYGCHAMQFPNYLPSVTSLEIRSYRAPIVIPSEEEFLKMTRLTSLDGNMQDYTAEALRTIGKLTALKHLSLDYSTSMVNLPIGAFRNFHNLHTIFMQSACSGSVEMTAIPLDIYELRSLTSVNMSCNKIRTLDPKISNLTNLKYLVLSHNDLTDLHSNIGKLTLLEAIHLNMNKLNSIPPEISLLTNLVSLRLYSNPLNRLPDEFGRLTQINLIHNSDHDINMPQYWRPYPPPVKGNPNRPKLYQLGMAPSLLQFLPQLTNLTELYLPSTRHLSLHKDIWKLRNLHTVKIIQAEQLFFSNQDFEVEMDKLDGNEIGPETDEMRKLEQDEALIYHQKGCYWHMPNYRSQFTNNALFFIDSLTKLSITHCNLTQIPPDLYRGCYNLTELDLSQNKIGFIDRTLIGGGLHNLSSLNLDSNQIRVIPFEMNDLLQCNMTSFSIKYNPFGQTYLANGVQVDSLQYPLSAIKSDLNWKGKMFSIYPLIMHCLIRLPEIRLVVLRWIFQLGPHNRNFIVRKLPIRDARREQTLAAARGGRGGRGRGK